MTHRRRMRPLAVALWLVVSSASLAAPVDEAVPPAADRALEARVTQIAQELRCLVCQNQTLADSDASLARDLRAQIRTLLRQGADDAQVRRYMTDRYGDFVRYRPPLKATTLLLWFAPGLLLAAGLGALASVLRRRARLDDAQFESDPRGVMP